MKTKFVVCLSLIIVFFSVSAEKTFACKCKPSDSPSYAFEKAQAVFAGTVVEIIKPEQNRNEPKTFKPAKIKFKVLENLKNVSGEEITITEDGGCDFRFRENESYLVYADLRATDYVAELCGGTTYLSLAKNELQCARNQKNGEPRVSIFGKINFYDRSSGKSLPIPSPEKIKIRWTSGKEQRESPIDDEGFYVSDNLKRGEAKIELILPETLTANFTSRNFSIREAACFKQNFSININGKVSGRITNSDGTPAANVSVSFSLKQNIGNSHHAVTDKNGRYELQGVAPGEYILAVRRSEMTSAGTFVNPHFLYFPKTKDFAQAATIKLDFAEELSNLDLQFPADFDAGIQQK